MNASSFQASIVFEGDTPHDNSDEDRCMVTQIILDPTDGLSIVMDEYGRLVITIEDTDDQVLGS